jgi:hypothetical protein
MEMYLQPLSGIKGQQARQKIKEIRKCMSHKYLYECIDNDNLSEMINEDNKRKFFKTPINQKYIRKETIRLTPIAQNQPNSRFMYQYYIPNDLYYTDPKNGKKHPYYYFNLRSENQDLGMYDLIKIDIGGMNFERLQHPYIEFLQKYYHLESNQLPFYPFIYGFDRFKGRFQDLMISMETKKNLSSLDFSTDLFIDMYIDLKQEYSQYCIENLKNTSIFNCYFNSGRISEGRSFNYFEFNTNIKDFTAGGVLINSIILKVPEPPEILVLEERSTKIQIFIEKTFQYNDIALYKITYDPIKQIYESLNNFHNYNILNDLSKIPLGVKPQDIENELYGLHLIINNPLKCKQGAYGVTFSF